MAWASFGTTVNKPLLTAMNSRQNRNEGAVEKKWTGAREIASSMIFYLEREKRSY
jgi:hypothetical protein